MTGFPHQDDADDAGPYWQVEVGPGPILATAIHDGHDLRPEVADRLVLAEGDRLREEDPHTGRWLDVAPTRIRVERSRFEVDLNDAAVYRTPEGAWGLDLWSEPPTDGHVERSLAIYDAFYALVGSLADAKVAEHGRFVLLDLHSYNHRRNGPDEPPQPAQENPVVNVGTATMARDRWAHLVDGFIADLSSCRVGDEPLDVRENVRLTSRLGSGS
jgi:N-formylglutamate amidohydrolase